MSPSLDQDQDQGQDEVSCQVWHWDKNSRIQTTECSPLCARHFLMLPTQNHIWKHTILTLAYLILPSSFSRLLHSGWRRDMGSVWLKSLRKDHLVRWRDARLRRITHSLTNFLHHFLVLLPCFLTEILSIRWVSPAPQTEQRISSWCSWISEEQRIQIFQGLLKKSLLLIEWRCFL